jgi:hypothetical protein
MPARRTVPTVAAALFAAASGCGLSSDLPQSADVGSVELGFGIANGLSISAFDYSVGGNGFGPAEGTIRLGDPGATVSAFVGGIPAGTRYQLTLSARTDDGGTFCDAVSAFDVVPPETSALAISMVCVNANTVRTIDVGGTAHVCPAMASTTFALLDGAVTLSASAFSFDSTPIAFRWEASAGTLASPDEAVTSYGCSEPGAQRLRVTVSDGSCSDLAILDVTCPSPP